MTNSLFGQWRSTPRLGAIQMLQAYASMPWLRAFTEKIAGDVASLTWIIVVVTDPSGKRAIYDPTVQRCHNSAQRRELIGRYAKQGRVREIPDHPAIGFLNSGNSFFPGNVAKQLTQLHLDLVGEMAWLISDDGIMPTGYVPIPPTWVVALPADNGGYYRVMGPTGSWDVPPSSMLFGYHPDPANPFRRGIGISQVLGDELETDEYAAKYTKDWFVNRAIPPVLISGVGVQLPELKRLEEKWLAKFAKRGAGWLPHFMGREVQVHQLSQTFEQQQLGDLRGRERDTIRQVYGIPPEQIGDVKDSNRSTIAASDYIYNRRVIDPRGEFMRSLLQERLMPRFNDERLIIDYVSPVKEDEEFKLKVWQASSWAYTIDEWRGFGGQEPLPGGTGKVHMIPFSATPSTLAPESLPDPNAPEGPALPGLPPGRARRLTDGDKTLGPDGPRKVSSAAKPAALSTRGQKVMREMVREFGQHALDSVTEGEAFRVQDPMVVEHLREWSGDRIAGKVNATTRRNIRDALADGIAAGDNLDGLSERIREVFVATEARAETIARTEVTRSSNFAALEGMKQAGVEQKEWLATMDDLTREAHAELDGQVVGIDDSFETKEGDTAQYPGEFGDPALDINCRCGVLPVIDKEAAAAVIVTRAARWKHTEALRAPYVRALRRALHDGFAEQERAVLEALRREYVGPGEARVA